MRVISKKISYDNLISRLPGVITSIMDSWEIPDLYGCVDGNNKEVFYSYDSAVNRAHEYNINSSLLEYDAQFVEFDKNNLIEFSVGNYGLIPSDVIIPSDIASKITDYTDIYVNIPDSNGGYYDLSWPKNDEDPHYEGRKIISGGTEVKILTYYTLNKWYSFFKEYYTLINSPEQIRVYESAVDYYNKTIKVKNEEQLAYYQSLDDTFHSRGGKEMYNWISNNCIIQYQIPAKFAEKWNTTFLYYPDAIKWYYWFKIRSEYYKDIENVNDCKNVDSESGGSCCDCSEFFKLGGKELYDDLKAWVDGVEINTDFMTKSASITIPVSITNTIDDLGEMSIFSSKWQAGVNYHNTISDDTVGTVANIPSYVNSDGDTITENEVFLMESGEGRTGYKYDEKYYENVFNSYDWYNYTEYYTRNHPKYFSSYDESVNPVIEYAFSPVNGSVIYNKSTESETIPYVKEEFIIVNGEFIKVIDSEYVIPDYSSITEYNIKKTNTKLPVITDGAVKYAELNGKRFYAVNEGNNKWVIYFFKKYNCYDSGSTVYKQSYVLYNNSLFLKNGNTVTIEEKGETKTYNVFDGYFSYNSVLYYISGNSVVISEEQKRAMKWGSLSVDSTNSTVTINHILDVKNANIITGYTDSKLELLRRNKINTDELGNDLPGYIDFELSSAGTHYNTAYDGCELDLLYKVGQFSDIEYQKRVDNVDYFSGNYLEKIEFYYLDSNGNKLDISVVTGNDSRGIIRQYFEDGNKYVPGLSVYCDFTYYIGATLNFDKNNSTYKLAENRHKGVKYRDTYTVSRNVGSFYMSDKSTFGFTYYELTSSVSAEYLCDFRDVNLTNMSYFEMEIMTFQLIGGTKYKNEFKTDYWEKNNGMVMSPVFRPEYNLFSTTQQNNKNDIYIDRGISAAFERHLKLLETHNMESLENYGNGYFKISEY